MKTISRKTFVWAHVGVIIFHMLVVGLILYAAFSEKDNKILLTVTGSVLGIVSLMLKNEDYMIKA
jgi:hypothetical protein